MSSILDDALKAIQTYEKVSALGRQDSPAWPDSYEACVQHLHGIERDTHNCIEHKLISIVWTVLFYKTWMHYRKTYILDTDFFLSLTKARAVKIYPSVLKTIPFNTFAVDLSGSDIFNGYILCGFDITDAGIYCSFMAHSYDGEEDSKDKQFGVFLDSSDMDRDEKGELYFDLSEDSEKDTDIRFFRNPKITDTLRRTFEKRLYKQYKKLQSKHPVFRPGFMEKDDGKKLEDIENDYFVNLKNINDDTRYFLLKKALIQFAYYLCTPKPDTYETGETRRAVKRAEKLKKNLDDIEYKYKAGSRIGARIRLGRAASDDIGEPVGYFKGTTKCPHVRAAHWTHVWCGTKNDQHIEPRFIEVTFVNYDLGEIDEVCNEVSDRVKKNWEGENLICRTLDALGVTYKRQSPVVIDGHRYKFDVGMKLRGKACYIEYDGEQHFYPVSIYGGQEGFDRTRAADRIKNDHCYQNDIPLLRISYKNKGDIDRIVKAFVDSQEMRFTKDTEDEYYAIA